MANKIKGICKGSFKYISHLFVVKGEREMEIGFPTDVKHVAHIGWDGPDGTAPTWMNDFKAGSGMAVTSAGSIGGSRDPTWSSQDFEQSLGRHPSSAIFGDNIPKKQKRRKTKSTSSSPRSSSARSSRASKYYKSMLSSEDNDHRSIA